MVKVPVTRELLEDGHAIRRGLGLPPIELDILWPEARRLAAEATRKVQFDIHKGGKTLFSTMPVMRPSSEMITEAYRSARS